MKKLPYLNEISKSAVSIDSFAGLNKGFRISENELSESYNMSSADYPVLSTREKRKKKDFRFGENYQSGIASVVNSDGFLYVLATNGDLYCEDNEKIELGVENNKIIRMGNMLYVYPSGKLVRLPSEDGGEITVEETVKSLEIQSLGEGLSTVTFFPARLSASDGRIGHTMKDNEPNAGDYFVSTQYGLQMYGDTGSGEYDWISAEPDGIMVQAYKSIGYTDEGELKPVYYDFSEYFKVNDAVFLSGTQLDSSYVVDSFGTDSDGNPAMFLIGYTDVVHTAETCIFDKKMPYGLEYVIEHNNRLWGCYYGLDEQGSFINEIYASAQNDPTNWYRYDGTLSQSYTMSVVSDGSFTGAAVINGYPTFFKEDCMHRIYGDSPSDFQLTTYKCAGVQKGSELSLASFNGTFFYKSNIGIMQISDGYPVKISGVLGKEQYSEAVGGTDGNFYYVTMKDRYGDRMMYVYDLNTGIWHCEDSPENITMFFNFGCSLYAVSQYPVDEDKIEEAYNEYINATNSLIKAAKLIRYLFLKAAAVKIVSLFCFSKSEAEDISFPEAYYTVTDVNGETVAAVSDVYEEDDIRWHFETGDIGYSYYYTKHVEKICARLQADTDARVDIEILYDSQGEWLSLEHITGDSTVKMYNIEFRPQRCDHFRLRFSGIGSMKLVNITEMFAEGSELQ